MFTALYRTYRPRSFDEVMGQDHVVSVLRGAIAKNQIGHAYLFHGSRGIGKTSIARIFAREIGCAPEDIYEIDGASNRKIEDIRALREAVQTLPFSSPYKIYIIDEVHMLTKEAFNALLKTLEEPPAHIIFMLATTEYEKLPDTIVSRCQVFTLRKPSIAMVTTLIEEVCAKEQVMLERESAELIALLGDGSFRDALGTLQKVVNISTDTKLSQEEVERVTGAPSFSLIHDFLSACAEGNVASALSALQECTERNIEVGIFLKRVLHVLRTVLLVRFDPSRRAMIEQSVSATQWTFIASLMGKEGARLNAGLLSGLLDASLAVRQATIPELPVELALMRLLVQNDTAVKEK